MTMLFDELFSIFLEAEVIEQTWHSIPTPNHVAEAIADSPYTHDYLFCHATDE